MLHHIGRYGVPATIQSNRGPEFVNDIIQEFIKIIGTEHIKTVQYSKEENAVVERCNRELLRHTRGLVYQIGNGNRCNVFPRSKCSGSCIWIISIG